MHRIRLVMSGSCLAAGWRHFPTSSELVQETVCADIRRLQVLLQTQLQADYGCIFPTSCHCQVVQPLFFFLAEQIDLAGQQAEEEPALRIAYDDVNESCCSPQAVYKLVKALKQQYTTAAKQQAQDLWQALQQVKVPWSCPCSMMHVHHNIS